MALAKRIILFLLVNVLVVSTISFILYFFNIQPYLTRYGLNLPALAVFCLIWGMAGSLISLFLSKHMAKWMMGVQIIDPSTRDPAMAELLRTVHTLSQKAGLPKMPEVGIYRSAEVNAFATGPSRSNSLVAVSSGLLQRMNKEEVEGVLGHEVTHIANGDMVTMTLLQGIVNAFVMFFARILAFAVHQAMSRTKDEDSSSISPFAYQLTVFFFEIVFMVLGSLVIARFSRFREFRADAGGARLAGPQKMIASLLSLKQYQERQAAAAEEQPKAFQAFKISGGSSFLKLFASHPPLDERIAKLKTRVR